MHNEALSAPETGILNGFVEDGLLMQGHLPLNASVGLDSMGPMRDPKTDMLFSGTVDALGNFADTLRRYNMMLVVATNGPDIEGMDILQALPHDVQAFAITEGGGKYISRTAHGEFFTTSIANEEELKGLDALEEYVGQNAVMYAMLHDRDPQDGSPPIRTPYDTNIVFTLPTNLKTLYDRIAPFGIRLEHVIPGIDDSNYVEKVLGFAEYQYAEALRELGLEGSLNMLIKKQNRRVYVSTRHLVDGTELSKRSGAEFGSRTLAFHLQEGITQYPMAPEYQMGNAIYIADKAVDITTEGQKVIGASERNMITGSLVYLGDSLPEEGMNVVRLTQIPYENGKISIAEVSCRLAINVTMSSEPPTMYTVEGVPILDIGSGIKSLAATSELYKQLHG